MLLTAFWALPYQEFIHLFSLDNFFTTKEVAAFGTHSWLCSRKEKSSSCSCTVNTYIVHSSIFHGKNKSNNCSNYNNGNDVCSDILQCSKVFRPTLTPSIPVWQKIPLNGPCLKCPMKMNKDPYFFSQRLPSYCNKSLYQHVSLENKVLLNVSHTS